MPSNRIPHARMEELLTSQLRDLNTQVLKAQQAQRELQIKQSIMSAMCTALQAVQHALDLSEEDVMELNPTSVLTSADITFLDQQLNEQQPCASSYSCNVPVSEPHSLHHSSSRQSCSKCDHGGAAQASAGAQADGWPEDAMSPPDDPLRFFRDLLEGGPLPWAATLTLPALQQQYLASCKEGLLHLVLLDNQQHLQQPWQVQRSLAAVKQLVQLHLQRWVSLVAYGRGDLLYQFHLSNCLTGERVEEQELRPYQVAAGNLGLTQQQKQHIADCMPIFKQLQQAVLDELQQLQQQPVEEPLQDAVSSGKTLLPMGMIQKPNRQQLSQQKHRQRTQRLHMLLRKQHMIGVCCNAYVLGCMTHYQLAKLGQFVFPFPAFMFLLATEVEKLMEQEQAAAGGE